MYLINNLDNITTKSESKHCYGNKANLKLSM